MNISGADDHQLLCWTAMMVMIAIGREEEEDGRWTMDAGMRDSAWLLPQALAFT